MVEPVSMTVGAVAAALIAKSVEKTTDRVADGALEASSTAVGRLVTWLRGKLQSTERLDLVEAAPDSQRAIGSLGDAIDAEIVTDDDRHELLARVNALRLQQAPNQSAIGEYIYQADRGSTITVSYGEAHAAPPT